MNYRDHKGSLEDSMATVQTVRTKQQLLKHLSSVYGKEISEVKFKYACYDERIEWDTYYVLAKVNTDRFCIVGMSNSNQFED